MRMDSLDMSPLKDMCITNIFSYSAACHFIFKTESFEMHKFLIVMKFNIPILGFVFG